MTSQKRILIFSIIVLMFLRVVRGHGKEYVYVTDLTEKDVPDNTDYYEADDDIDLDEGSLPTDYINVDTLNLNQTPNYYEEPLQETIYEDLHSKEAINHLANEYLRIIENEIAARTIKEVMARLKQTLKKKSALRTISRLSAEIVHFMTRPKSPQRVREYLKNRLDYYTHLATPERINQKFEKIKSFVNNENIPKHLNFVNDAIIEFIKKPNVVKEMAKAIVLINSILHKEIPSFLLG